jgi:thioredoxin-related protein
VITRRKFSQYALTGLTTFSLSKIASAARDLKPILRDNGTYTQSWFLESFLNLKDDLAESHDSGKRLAIIWEQLGCKYCRDTHLINFAQPEIRDFVEQNFNIIQVDIHGMRDVIGFDGTTLSEKKQAQKNHVRFTPTIQFFPDTPEDISNKSGKIAEVFRMPGYLKPKNFLALFQFVQEKSYERTSFKSYLKLKLLKP